MGRGSAELEWELEMEDRRGRRQGDSWRGAQSRRGRRSWRRRQRGGPEAVAAAAAWGQRRWRWHGEVLVAGARSGGGRRRGGWTPSPAFCEQPLEMEETPFFSQMTARVCGGGGVRSHLIEPKIGREEKGPT